MIPFGTYDTHLRLHKAGMSHRSCDGMSVTKRHLLQRLRTAKEHCLPACKARPQEKNWPSATATAATTAPPEPKMEPVPSPDEPLAGATSTELTSAARPKQAKKTGLHAPNTMPLGRDWRKKFTQQIDEEANKKTTLLPILPELFQQRSCRRTRRT